jgi:hypothetical protein
MRGNIWVQIEDNCLLGTGVGAEYEEDDCGNICSLELDTYLYPSDYPTLFKLKERPVWTDEDMIEFARSIGYIENVFTVLEEFKKSKGK